MKVLVAGCDGYIGVVLCDLLIKAGHDVTGLDTGFYRMDYFYNPQFELQKLISKDTRQIESKDLVGFDAVIHLADLSNDPLGVFNSENTYDISHKGSVRLATTAKESQVKRFIYSSSCSVYGVASEGFVNEESAVNPQTAYAKSKVLVENDLRKLADDTFIPVILRNATVYGPSPRMRFDLVLNNLCGTAFTDGVIKMISDGTPWRPIVHVLDVARAFQCALEAPKESVQSEIFNVGQNKENYQVRDIARIVAEVFAGCKLEFGPSGGDTRSYRVSFDKIHSKLPGFSCTYTALDGAQQLRDLFTKINLSPEMFNSRSFTRIKQLEYLVNNKLIDDKFYWKAKS